MARILIVEDEFLIAEDLMYKLHRLGHTIVGHATTGETAVQQALEAQPEVILMDIRLHGKMSGLEAAKLLHERQPFPVVFLTAHASALASTMETQPRSLVISKPFTLDQVESVIQQACRVH